MNNDSHKKWSDYLCWAQAELGWKNTHLATDTKLSVGVIKKARRGDNLSPKSRRTIEECINKVWEEFRKSHPEQGPLNWPLRGDDAFQNALQLDQQAVRRQHGEVSVETLTREAALFEVGAMVQAVKNIVASSRSREEMLHELLAIPIDTPKGHFSTGLFKIIAEQNIDLKEFNESVESAGLPDGLPLFPEATIQEYMQRLVGGQIRLSKAQQLVWKVAQLVYPPYSGDCDIRVKNAARYLAYYWNVCIKEARDRWKFSIAEDLVRERSWEKHRVMMLCWLELPLITQTGHPALAKTGLFELGRAFEKVPRTRESAPNSV